MRVAVLGGDGYLGWATAMHLSAGGHTVRVCDNMLRRKLCGDLRRESLFAVPPLVERAEIWAAVSGFRAEVAIGDLTDWTFARKFIGDFSPDTIIHFAELPSAPYSMIDRDTSALVLQNNLLGTHNLVHAVRETCPDAHIIKLGTMGEYGTPNIESRKAG